MKIYTLITILLVGTKAYSQNGYGCKNVIETSGKTYCTVYNKCGPLPRTLMSEGNVELKGFTLKRNYYLYRHGLWIFYDSSGSGIPRDTIEFYHGNQLGEYEFTNPATDEKVKYSIVKEGNSTITYFDAKGRKTEENIFDLNEKKMKTYKKFYDKKGNLINEETWIGKKLVK